MKVPEWYDPEDAGARKAREIRTKLLPEMFEASHEFKLWREFATALQDLSHETTETVALPTRFLRLAADQITNPDHFPFTFPVLERVFNRIAASLRLPPSHFMPPRPVPDGADTYVSEAKENRLWKQFEASDEYLRYLAFVSALENIAQSTAPTVQVPAAFVRIAHLGLEPFRFDVLRDVWNGLCDDLRLPEQRREGPAPPPEPRRLPIPRQGDFMKDRDAAHTERFLATEEGQDWQDFVETANKALEVDSELVYVPAAFLRRVIADIAVDPLMFPAMAEAWERVAAPPQKGK